MKRQFRARAGTSHDVSSPEYPTLERFDSGRRRFLRQLGATLFGAGAIATLSACGSRPVGEKHSEHPPGGAPMPDSRLDDAGVQQKDLPRLNDIGNLGRAPAPDARVDSWVFEGDVAQPDARIDEPDAWTTGGAAQLPDAAGDP